MTAEDFKHAFAAGWVAAGRQLNTPQFQIACIRAWSAYLTSIGS